MSEIYPGDEALVGAWHPPTNFVLSKAWPGSLVKQAIPTDSENEVLVFDNLLSQDNCNELIALVENNNNWHPVSVQGRTDIPTEEMGSVRATAWAPELANQLWDRIRNLISKRIITPNGFSKYVLPVYEANPLSSTDWWQVNADGKYHRLWQPVGVSPVLRFMKYEGGEHFAHYDAAYDYPEDNRRTLFSLVIYLTSHSQGGETRFIWDGQGHLPVWCRYHQDWTTRATEREVLYASKPTAGKAIVFPHRLCHDVTPIAPGGTRYIIRGDIVCEPT